MQYDRELIFAAHDRSQERWLEYGERRPWQQMNALWTLLQQCSAAGENSLLTGDTSSSTLQADETSGGKQ